MVRPVNIYYTYAYLREDGTPYYIGKGKGNRAFDRHLSVKVPSRERILILKKNLSEEEAFRHEIYMIAVFGRKDKKSGILLNFTDGGDGPSGAVRTGAFRRRLSEVNRGKSLSQETRRKMSESRLGKPSNGGKIGGKVSGGRNKLLSRGIFNPDYRDSPEFAESRVRGALSLHESRWVDPEHPELGAHHVNTLKKLQRENGLPDGKENRVKYVSP